MSRLSITIMAVPEREEWVRDLQRQIGQRVPVSWDHAKRGPWGAAEQAWRTVKGGATHHLVLQDDAIVCRDFIRSCEAALDAVPSAPVAFYANRKVIEEARAAGSSWAITKFMTWGVATCLPVWLIPKFLDWQKKNIVPDLRSDDFRLNSFFEEYYYPVHCPAPSLVDHRDGPSVAGNHPPMRRVARWFVGTDRSGTEIDWSAGIDNPPTVSLPSRLRRKKNREKYLR
tara:strand:- start:2446 stop:3129 length:684 start_codon:yes stop_codon:yes gene_type:complete